PDLRPREVQPVPAGADHERDRRALPEHGWPRAGGAGPRHERRAAPLRPEAEPRPAGMHPAPLLAGPVRGRNGRDHGPQRGRRQGPSAPSGPTARPAAPGGPPMIRGDIEPAAHRVTGAANERLDAVNGLGTVTT